MRKSAFFFSKYTNSWWIRVCSPLYGVFVLSIPQHGTLTLTETVENIIVQYMYNDNVTSLSLSLSLSISLSLSLSLFLSPSLSLSLSIHLSFSISQSMDTGQDLGLRAWRGLRGLLPVEPAVWTVVSSFKTSASCGVFFRTVAAFCKSCTARGLTLTAWQWLLEQGKFRVPQGLASRCSLFTWPRKKKLLRFGKNMQYLSMF